MTYRIHYRLSDGSEDSVIIEGETVEDIRAKADIELQKRGADTSSAWSEAV